MRTLPEKFLETELMNSLHLSRRMKEGMAVMGRLAELNVQLRQ